MHLQKSLKNFLTENEQKFYKFAQFFLTFWLIVINVIHLNIGLADNGDWIRTVTWFSDKPVGFSEYWPTELNEYLRRFGNYWIPEWEIELKPRPYFSSSLIIWIPGFVINYALLSKETLYIPLVSLLPRIWLIYLVFQLSNFFKNSNYRFLYLFFCITPLSMIISTTDYLAYLNSFYQEAGSIVFLITLYAFLIFDFGKSDTTPKLFRVILILILLSLTKAQSFYWLLLFLMFLFLTNRRALDKVSTLGRSLILVISLLVIPVSIVITRHPMSIFHNQFNSLFYGALTFSDIPEYHLKRLGFDEEAVKCIGNSSFSNPPCLEKYMNHLSLMHSISVYIDEYKALFRAVDYATSNMQVISLEYLGKYREGERIQYRQFRLNLWSEIKKIAFPRGFLLLVFIIIVTLISIIVIQRRRSDYDGSLDAVFSLMTMLFFTACIIEIFISIIGDGKQELIKHLFSANLTFDLGLISLSGMLISLFASTAKTQYLFTKNDG